ncbi:NUDIX domain-containing protein [Candidatus Uhrbacteria bacterium]|nr:NUDIX domain-containing protein [Candidatus Uhrbacteria bacterium]
MELLEIVSEQNNTPSGVFLGRKDAIAQKAWCRSTNVFVLNPAGQILCHQRSLEKERFPGAWCTHMGGHVSQGETYESNASKELREEAGIDIDPVSLVPWRITKHAGTRVWIKEFVTCLDLPASAFTPQKGEVEEFAWKSLEEIIKEIKIKPWLAGTHDIIAEYQCMRAVITAASSRGIMSALTYCHTWQPPMVALS